MEIDKKKLISNYGHGEKRLFSSIKDWTRGKLLGEGAFGQVYLATNNDTGEKFVAKCVNNRDVVQKLALNNEIKVLKQCKSPYIVKYLGFATSKVTWPTNMTILLDVLMEYVPRGNVLQQTLCNGGGLEEPIVAAYTRDVLRGLYHLHLLGIVHGDLKCSNFLIGNNNIKICDFGSAKIFKNGDLVLAPRPGDRRLKHRIFVTGTEGWKAPEVVSEDQQDEMSDIYSLGCCVVEMCTGLPPGKDPSFYALEIHEGEPNLSMNPVSLDVPPNYSQECHDFVKWCLAFDPQDRPSTKDLLQCSWIVSAPPYPKVILPRVRAKSIIKKMSNFMGCGSSKNNTLPQSLGRW